MKIKLLINVPVNPSEGMSEGRILEVIRVEPRESGNRYSQAGVWVMGDTGGEVKILDNEYETVED